MRKNTTIKKCDDVFGLADYKPLRGFPVGQYKIRLREECLAVLYVRSEWGIRAYYIKEERGWWVPGAEIGENIRGIIPSRKEAERIFKKARALSGSISIFSIALKRLGKSMSDKRLAQNVNRTCRCKAYESCYRCLKPRAQGGGKK